MENYPEKQTHRNPVRPFPPSANLFLTDPGLNDFQLDSLLNNAEFKATLMFFEHRLKGSQRRSEKVHRLQKVFGSSKVAIIPAFFPTDKEASEVKPSTKLYSQAWESLINDNMLYFLLERDAFSLFPFQHQTAQIANAIYRYACILEKYKPTDLFFSSSPHSVHSYVFSRIVEISGGRVFYLENSIFPWRYYLFEGLSKNPTVQSSWISSNPSVKFSNDRRKCLQYFARKRRSKDFAMAELEKKRIKKNGGKVYSSTRSVIQSWKRPDLILNKHLCYKKLVALSSRRMPEKFIVFFLHFQPERTTLPEGYGFTQQLAAIRILESSLPEDVYVVVKEHPSTFSWLCHWKVRLPGFYERVISERVYLSDPNADPYALVDSSLCVCTITGTIAAEAILRGKPAIVFGAGPLFPVNSKKLHVYKRPEALQNFLESCIAGDRLVDSKDEFDHIYLQVHASTLDGSVESMGLVNSDDSTSRQRALASLYTSL